MKFVLVWFIFVKVSPVSAIGLGICVVWVVWVCVWVKNWVVSIGGLETG